MDDWLEFTKENYARLLRLAKKWEFVSYTGNLDKENIILWRHDVDASVHAAYCLAEIEETLDVKSTYFFQLGSLFYNVFEKHTYEMIKAIQGLGHSIGLHFDPTFYGNISRSETLDKMAYEKHILENLLDTNISAISFHNPEFGNWFNEGSFVLCGMFNAYSQFLKDNFKYASDSCGYWRFESIEKVLQGEYSRLQVLTHPVWWTAKPLPPREKIKRYANDRARYCLRKYDSTLEEMGRKNIS